MRNRSRPAILLPLAVLAGCQSMSAPTSDPVREEAAIRATDARWLAAAQAHDLERTVSYWTDDVYMMPPGGPPMIGKEALRRYVGGAFAIPDFSISWVTDRIWVAKSGDVAYAVGTDTIRLTTPDGKPVVEHNKAVAVWRKGPDGSWKCAVDIWNAADPEPAGTAQ
ncbi:MAG TPA: SgcJ/EcaC family oxidoreductase [Steroidobacteraceae bacterium]|nr:SgcJ/EcaC family oxidoreductase [Steroidobacteraceae bacterium]